MQAVRWRQAEPACHAMPPQVYRQESVFSFFLSGGEVEQAVRVFPFSMPRFSKVYNWQQQFLSRPPCLPQHRHTHGCRKAAHKYTCAANKLLPGQGNKGKRHVSAGTVSHVMLLPSCTQCLKEECMHV